MANDVEDLKSMAAEVIDCRKAVIEVGDRPDSCQTQGQTQTKIQTEALDIFLKSNGYLALGHGWNYVSAVEAKELLVAALRFSFCFGDEVLSAEDACNLADRFFALFKPDADWWTNYDKTWPYGHCPTGNPITDGNQWTFESGLGAIDSSRIGIFWLFEED